MKAFCNVAPHVGAWIEILFIFSFHILIDVAPHVGTLMGEAGQEWFVILVSAISPETNQ